MKRNYKLLIHAMFIIGVGQIIVSCTQEQKVTSEEEVRNYGKYFVEKLTLQQFDSITPTYADITKADSIAPVKTDTISVVESTPGVFDVTLTEGVKLKVNRAEDGAISVAESKGLFIFPEEKMEIAKKTGMWEDNLNDVQLAERFKDEAFFKYIQNQINKNTSNLITIGKFVNNGNGTGYYPLKNNTNVPIKGSEYNLAILHSYPVFMGHAVDYWAKKNIQEPGKDIEPGGVARYSCDLNSTFVGGELDPSKKIKGITWKLSPQQLQEKFASYTGQEYQEYLSSKK